MTTAELARKILQLIDDERAESINSQMKTQWRTRGEVLSKIQLLCFREAVKAAHHDGKLGGDGLDSQTVGYRLSGQKRFVSIRYDDSSFEDDIWCSPDQALSLRDWLNQEYEAGRLATTEEVQ